MRSSSQDIKKRQKRVQRNSKERGKGNQGDDAEEIHRMIMKGNSKMTAM